MGPVVFYYLFLSKTPFSAQCGDSTDLTCDHEGAIRVGSANGNKIGNECEHCVCSKNKKWKCMNICEDDSDENENDNKFWKNDHGWTSWSEWGDCSQTCVNSKNNAKRYRHRVCKGGICSLPRKTDFLENSNRNFNRDFSSGNRIDRGYVDMSISDCNYPLLDYCKNGNNGDQIGSDKNSPKFQSSCSMITEYRNLTSKVFKGADSSQLICTAKNVKVNQCGGGCNSKIVVKSEDPYIEQICQCCTYELDPIEPVRFIDYECTGGSGGGNKNSIPCAYLNV